MAKSKSKRRCKICGTTLSMYNRDTVCFHHQKDNNEDERKAVAIYNPEGNFMRTLLLEQGYDKEV
jgi:hypothetical protein